MRRVRAVLAEHPAGVALDQEPDHEREHDHAHQDPVPTRGAALPVTSAAGRSARPTGHGLTYAGSASWSGPAASSLPGSSELALLWKCSGLVTPTATAAGRLTVTAAGRRKATGPRSAAWRTAPGPHPCAQPCPCARPRPGAGLTGRQ